MSTYDNAATLDGWTLPPRCCGTWVAGLVCGICSNYVHIPANIELGEE